MWQVPSFFTTRVEKPQVAARGELAPSRASGDMQRYLCHTASADNLEATLMNLIFLHDKLG